MSIREGSVGRKELAAGTRKGAADASCKRGGRITSDGGSRKEQRAVR